MSLQRHQPEWKIDYQVAAEHGHDADYATHARRLIECLFDEISWVRLKAEGRMLNDEVEPGCNGSVLRKNKLVAGSRFFLQY